MYKFLILLLLPMFIFGQKIDTTNGQVILAEGVKHVIGKITEVDYTGPRIYINVLNDSTGVTTRIVTPKYIRGQKEFYIKNDSSNVMPPPLHVTNFWIADSIMYVEASEPVMVTLYNRNHKWKGTGVPWGKRELTNQDGYQQAQAFSFNHRWFTTRTIIEYKYAQPTPDDWDFAIELHPIRIGIPTWSHWQHYRTFYFSTYEHQ